MSNDGTTRSLVLETSGRIGQVAIAQETAILSRRSLDATRRHARDLAPTVQELLRERQWKPRDIDVVFVSVGPGSYTGLRVGIMSAKAFAYATDCKLLGVETFAAIAQQAPGLVSVIADAQQIHVYVQRFQVSPAGQTPIETSRLAIQSVHEWLKQLTPDTCVTGPGLRLHRQLVPESVPIAAEDTWDPRPETLLQLGLARLVSGQQDQVFKLEPLYARLSSAEENWARRK